MFTFTCHAILTIGFSRLESAIGKSRVHQNLTRNETPPAHNHHSRAHGRVWGVTAVVSGTRNETRTAGQCASDFNSRGGQKRKHPRSQTAHRCGHGCDGCEKSFRVMSPLHYASGAGHREIVELLIAGGANVNTKTSFGFFSETPLDKAGAVFDQLNGGKILQEQYRCLNHPTGFPILIFQHPDC